MDSFCSEVYITNGENPGIIAQMKEANVYVYSASVYTFIEIH